MRIARTHSRQPLPAVFERHAIIRAPAALDPGGRAELERRRPPHRPRRSGPLRPLANFATPIHLSARWKIAALSVAKKGVGQFGVEQLARRLDTITLEAAN